MQNDAEDGGWAGLPARRCARGLVGGGGGRPLKAKALRVAQILAELASPGARTIPAGKLPVLIEELPVCAIDRGHERCEER